MPVNGPRKPKGRRPKERDNRAHKVRTPAGLLKDTGGSSETAGLKKGPSRNMLLW